MQFSRDFSTFSTISAQERDGEEAVGAKKGHFSAEEIFVGAKEHPHSPGDFNHGHDVTQPLPSDVSIGKRPFMLIVAANQESPSRQIT
jgi:hypothetical protein